MSNDLLFGPSKKFAVFLQLTPRKRYQVAEFDTQEEAEGYIAASSNRETLILARRRPVH